MLDYYMLNLAAFITKASIIPILDICKKNSDIG